MAGQRGDAAEPGLNRRIPAEVEPALGGDVRVAVERDVRERRAVADEEVPSTQMPLDRAQRTVPGRGALLEAIGERLRLARIGKPEADDGDRRLVVVLLEEHPLQHLRALVAVVRDEPRPLAEVPEDRARLGERPAVAEHERRDA